MGDHDQIPAKAAKREAELVMEIIRQVGAAVEAGQPADRALAQIYRDHREFGSRDRRFFSAAVFSFFRWRGWTARLRLDPASACAASFLLDAALMHPAVKLLAASPPLGPADLQPLGLLSIEEKAASLAGWLALDEPPSIDDLVPPWLKAELFVAESDDAALQAARCLTAFQKRPPTWLRAPRNREAALVDALLQRGHRVHQHPVLSGAVAIDDNFNTDQLREALGVAFEIQDLASQCVGAVCDPADGQHWWDACAGAGGKAIHLADLMSNRGKIIATDLRKESLQELQRRAQQARARFIQVEVRDATAGPPADTVFDGVLVDAPCSGIGTWSRNPDARWRTAPSEIEQKAALQLALLRAAAPGVRPGGILVYSVCTITRAETVDVVRAFLSGQTEFQPADATHPLTGAPTREPVWVWPWDGPCDGMFIARMRRAAAR
ncbi:MAG: RsmB/NOP family class I SAM-dependent RNA methyltransferase [Kiritimatiellae bacterium]|nr:RsmB/NOP family class I SAM-dependent RNA methyltransferase [Kiritimatiellia bacterium]